MIIGAIIVGLAVYLAGGCITARLWMKWAGPGAAWETEEAALAAAYGWPIVLPLRAVYKLFKWARG